MGLQNIFTHAKTTNSGNFFNCNLALCFCIFCSAGSLWHHTKSLCTGSILAIGDWWVIWDNGIVAPLLWAILSLYNLQATLLAAKQKCLLPSWYSPGSDKRTIHPTSDLNASVFLGTRARVNLKSLNAHCTRIKKLVSGIETVKPKE